MAMAMQHQVKFDDRDDTQLDGTYGCLLILFMVFVLGFGSWLFTAVAKKVC